MKLLVVGVALISYISSTRAYNTNRQYIVVKNGNCGYYENPAFQPKPLFIQSRVAETPQNPVFVIENRLIKGSSCKPYVVSGKVQYQKKSPSYFANLTPADLTELTKLNWESSEENEEANIDYNKLWKIGEIPFPKSLETLPDVYVNDDAPAISDLITMERSELTEEAHDLENVEIGEKDLADPARQVKDVVFETISVRKELPTTENPAVAMFKEINVMKMKQERQKVEMEAQTDKTEEPAQETTTTASKE